MSRKRTADVPLETSMKGKRKAPKETAKKEKFFFLHKRDHTNFLNSDQEFNMAEIQWIKSGQTVKIELEEKTYSDFQDVNKTLYEQQAWEYLTSSLPEDKVAPYYEDQIAMDCEPQQKPKKKYRKEKKHDKIKDRRAQAKVLLEKGFTVSDVSKQLKMKDLTLYRLILRNSFQFETSIFPGHPQILQEEHLKAIEKLLNHRQSKITCIKQIREHLITIFGRDCAYISLSTLHATIRRLKYVKKKAKLIGPEGNSQRVFQLRKEA